MFDNDKYLVVDFNKYEVTIHLGGSANVHKMCGSANVQKMCDSANVQKMCDSANVEIFMWLWHI